MAKNNFYAVIKGFKTGIFTSWSKVQPLVSGYQGAEFKGFVTHEEAQEYMEGTQETSINVKAQEEVVNTEYELFAYVDGSKLGDSEGYGSGIVLLDKDRNILDKHTVFGNSPEFVSEKQIAGEIEAALYALEFAQKNNYKSIEIYYDYEGIKQWAEKTWKRNSNSAIYYSERFDNIVKYANLSVHFSKVKAHTGDKFNEMADHLAKQAFSKEAHIENSDGSHSINGILSREDLDNLIENIKEYYPDLNVFNKKENEENVKYTFKYKNSKKVTATYTDNTMKLFLQGNKDSETLLLVVSYFVSEAPSIEDFLEIMNSVTKESITIDEVKKLMKKLLPMYTDNREESVFQNMLYQACVNYLDDKRLEFDYTYKITPLFRLLEHLLVDAYDSIGKYDELLNKQNRVYFGKVMIANDKESISKGSFSHRLDAQDIILFGDKKSEVVLDLYKLYKLKRNVYSHGGEEANDTQVINNQDEVKKIIEETFNIFNSYYELFVEE